MNAPDLLVRVTAALLETQGQTEAAAVLVELARQRDEAVAALDEQKEVASANFAAGRLAERADGLAWLGKDESEPCGWGPEFYAGVDHVRCALQRGEHVGAAT